MEKTEINSKVIELLNDFENLETMDASMAWNQTLMQKLVDAEAMNASNAVLPVSYVRVILIFTLLNAVCIFNIFNHTKQLTYNRIAKLNIISKELLMPTSGMMNYK
jgi:hypothetical protein